MPNVIDLHERKRGCGYRSPGGKYLILENPAFEVCGKLPLIVGKCPCCGEGIGRSRAPRWINAKKLFAEHFCRPDRLTRECKGAPPWTERALCLCPLYEPPEKAILLWIGEKFYPRPETWMREAREMGISRRISAVPKGFKVGETLVFVAHSKAIPNGVDERGELAFLPAIFQVFRPNAIDYVTAWNDDEDKLERLEKQGFRLVRVHQVKDQPRLPLGGTENE